MKYLSVIGLISLSASLVWGGPSVTVGADPISSYCKFKGGQPLRIQEKNGARFSVCFFKGGAAIGGNTLYNATRGTSEAVALILNPAKRPSSKEEFCLQSGGALRSYDIEGQNLTLCTFADASSVEVTTLFKGPKAAMNRNLVKALLEIINK